MRALLPRLVPFLMVMLTVVGLLHGYAWTRLVSDPAWPTPFGVVGTVITLALALFLPFSLIGSRMLRGPSARIIAWAGYAWLGTIFYVDVTLVVLDALRWVITIAPRTEALAAIGIASAVVSLGAVRGMGRPILRRVEVPIVGLDPALDGFRIVQLTDVHVGPVIRRAFVEKLVAEVKALSPDLVAVTGDLVDGSVAELRSEVAPLAELSAPSGVFFVTGNHEYFSGHDAWCEHVQTLGMQVLRNRHVVVERDGARFTLAGIDDAHAPRFGGHTDMKAALADRDPTLPVVLLAHQPRSVTEAAEGGVALQISGHTHGGQMQPFGALVRIEQPFLKGLHRVGSTAVWVSEGTGTWGPPLRIGTRSEISEITLRARPA